MTDQPTTDTTAARARPHILIIGGGLVGLTTAWRLQRELDRGDADVTLVNPQNYMVYQSLLPEVASGMLEPADVVVPLRRTLKRTRIVVGRLTGLDGDRRVATVEPIEAGAREIAYDHVVLALGSDTRMLPVPGLAEHAVGFTTVPEALFLRDHVLSRLEAAAHSSDEDARRRALTFVFVGGGYSGVEALGELQAMAHAACALYPTITPRDQRWVLIEATGRILPMVDEDLADNATRALRRRGVDVRLETTMESAEDGVLTLSDGDELRPGTLVWAAGVAPSPLLADLGLPRNDTGAVEVDAMLRVHGRDGVWAAGDCAAVPDLVDGGTCPPSAQYALREARQLAKNLAATVRGTQLEPFRYRQRGEMLTLGHHRGVAQVLGRHLHGVVPWYLRRLYHVGRVPSARRKVQVWADWTLRLLLGRDVVSLGGLRRPGQPLQEAAESQSRTS
jgi:NADH dehydrogenase